MGKFAFLGNCLFTPIRRFAIKLKQIGQYAIDINFRKSAISNYSYRHACLANYKVQRFLWKSNGTDGLMVSGSLPRHSRYLCIS